MQCVVPTCNRGDTSQFSSQEAVYFKFPLEPSLRAAWLETLHKVDWAPEEGSVVCCKHFLPEDIVESNHGMTLREGAVPVINVQVCRICFAMDCRLYLLTEYKTLYETYETLTGLLIQEDTIPPYLCNKCAHQLLVYARLRSKSLEAHSVLLEISTKHNCITRESIKSIPRNQNMLSLDEAQDQSEYYDIDTEISEIENVQSTDQIDSHPSDSALGEVTVDCVKIESDEVLENDIFNGKGLPDNVIVHIIVSEESLPDTDYCKEENNDTMKLNVEEIEHGDISKDTLEGDAMDDTTQSEDGSQNSEQSMKEIEVFVVTEEENSVHDASKKLEHEDRPSVNGEGRQNDEQEIRNEDDKNLPERMNQKEIDTTRKLEAEGKISSDASLRLGEVNQETINEILVEVTIVTDDVEPTNIHENQDGLSKLEIAKLSCDKCPFQTISKIQMSSHLKAHAASQSYNCSMCYYKTVHKRSLACHKRVHSGEKPHPCDKCHKTFSQKSSLLVHMRQHTGKKPYSCNVCKRKFSEISTLRRHLTIHTGEKPYQCDVCSKRFRQVGQLKKHLRIHAGEKPYICDYCNKAFGQKSHLIKHMRIHTDDLQYACPICNKIYRQNITFEKHMSKHSSKKSYSCEVCKKVFSQRSCLRVHFKKHVIENK